MNLFPNVTKNIFRENRLSDGSRAHRPLVFPKSFMLSSLHRIAVKVSEHLSTFLDCLFRESHGKDFLELNRLASRNCKVVEFPLDTVCHQEPRDICFRCV